MQTFMPYPSFSRSASVLDRQRLCKQRVESLQILDALKALRTTRLKIRHIIIRNDGVIVKETNLYFRYPFRVEQLIQELNK